MVKMQAEENNKKSLRGTKIAGEWGRSPEQVPLQNLLETLWATDAIR